MSLSNLANPTTENNNDFNCYHKKMYQKYTKWSYLQQLLSHLKHLVQVPDKV